MNEEWIHTAVKEGLVFSINNRLNDKLGYFSVINVAYLDCILRSPTLILYNWLLPHSRYSYAAATPPISSTKASSSIFGRLLFFIPKLYFKYLFESSAVRNKNNNKYHQSGCRDKVVYYSVFHRGELNEK
jgi:hypothetical protein